MVFTAFINNEIVEFEVDVITSDFGWNWYVCSELSPRRYANLLMIQDLIDQEKQKRQETKNNA